MAKSYKPKSLSMQIFGSVLIVLAMGLLGLVIAGHNAITVADQDAMARQERFAVRGLAAELARLPEQQRSSTIWDDAVLRTRGGDDEWMDANLGSWMQDYFGHSENYVLDAANQPLFASVAGEQRSLDVYQDLDDVIRPLVTQLRLSIVEVSEGLDNPYEELAKISIVVPLQFDSRAVMRQHRPDYFGYRRHSPTTGQRISAYRGALS